MKYSVFVSENGHDEITQQFKMSHELFISVCRVLLKEAKWVEFKKNLELIEFWTTCSPSDIEIDIYMFLNCSDGSYDSVVITTDMNRFLEVKEQVLRTNKRAKAAQLKFLMEDSK